MNTEPLGRIPWLALGTLWLAYAFLGWYLAVHHIIWLIGATVIAVMLTTIGKGTPLLKQLSWFSFQSLFITIAISLAISLCLILFVSDFQFLGLIFLPVVATFWADLEMRSAQFEQHQILLWFAAIAGLGIGLGEVIDLFLIPSIPY
jgi:hypothetical protein